MEEHSPDYFIFTYFRTIIRVVRITPRDIDRITRFNPYVHDSVCCGHLVFTVFTKSDNVAGLIITKGFDYYDATGGYRWLHTTGFNYLDLVVTSHRKRRNQEKKRN